MRIFYHKEISANFLNQKGLAPVALMLIVFLFLAVIFGVFLVQQVTHYLPKAASEPIDPCVSCPQTSAPPSDYYIQTEPNQSIVLNVGDTYTVQALLKIRSNNAVVNDYSNLTYSWSIDSNGANLATITPQALCTSGIAPPCPQDHLEIHALTVGSNNIRVKVTRNSDNQIIAAESYYLNVMSEPTIRLNVTYPDISTDVLTVGQNTTIRWDSNVDADYFNVYYTYYKLYDGTRLGGYIGTVNGSARSIQWTVPTELAYQKAKVIIEAKKNSSTLGFDNSDSYFSVMPAETSPNPSAKIGDINNDGTVGIQDFAILLSKWGTTNASADLNGDGSVGIQDFAILLSKWET